MLTEELLTFLFDGQPHLLYESMAEWLGSSRRFTAFVGTFRDKIRKKLRVTQDAESLRDLRLELETAYLLHQEPKLSVLYEPGPPEKGRASDFAVRFTTSVTFMLEVTRLRTESRSSSSEEPMASSTSLGQRLVDAVCSKLGQLRPQHSNVLLVGVDDLQLTRDDLRSAMLQLQQRVEREDMDFLQRHRFRDRSAFFRHFMLLSEILVRDTTLAKSRSLLVWENPQARYPLPGKVQNALRRSQAV